jgi:hypothetical protein
VLDLKEPVFPRFECQSAYNEGDLLAALAAYGHRTQSIRAGRVYHAGLLLAVGQVDKANRLNAASRGAGRQALLTLIAAVTLKPRPDSNPRKPRAIGLRNRITGSRKPISRVRSKGNAQPSRPEFGFAWTRLAELHFSFAGCPGPKQLWKKECSFLRAIQPRMRSSDFVQRGEQD